jgi:alanyl-tRNA synthetase
VMDTLRERMGAGVICLGSAMEGKVTLIASVSKDLTKRIQAGRIMQEIAPLVGGKGGGRPDLAQGGGPDVSHLDEALARVDQLIIKSPGSV